MSEKQAEKAKVFKKIDPFSGKEVDSVFAKTDRLNLNFNDFEEIGLELDKETGNTKVVVTGHRDLHREIQEFKDDCGFEGMKKLIETGRAVPRDFYDDGKHGQDAADLPDNVNDAYRAALAANKKSDAVLKGLGVDKDSLKTQEAIEAAITAAVNRRFEQMQKEIKENAKAE